MAEQQLQPVRLVRYFFPVQTVVANPEHKSDKPKEIHTKFSSNFNQADDAPDSYMAEVKLSLDEDKSVNPTYFFEISAFGFFEVVEDLDSDMAKALAYTNASQILIGSLREHLALLTSRGPWDMILQDIVSISVKPQIPKETEAHSD